MCLHGQQKAELALKAVIRKKFKKEIFGFSARDRR
jgi:HEPN domain-containing protein